MITDDNDGTARPIFHVPATVREFKPTKSLDLHQVAKLFLNNQDIYAEALPYLVGIAGEGPTVTGCGPGDEWYMTAKLQALAASHEAYAILATLTPNHFRRVIRSAYRSHTGTAIGKLMHQGIHLRIEDKRAHKMAAE